MRNVAKPTSKNVSFERRVLSIYIYIYMVGCQHYGPFLGTLNFGGRIMIRTQKGTIILTTNHILYIYICHGLLYVATSKARGQSLFLQATKSGHRQLHRIA